VNRAAVVQAEAMPQRAARSAVVAEPGSVIPLARG
jgi:hypothetical protein